MKTPWIYSDFLSQPPSPPPPPPPTHLLFFLAPFPRVFMIPTYNYVLLRREEIKLYAGTG